MRLRPRHRIDKHDRRRAEPNDPERNADGSCDFAEGWVLAHGETEQDDTDRHQQQSHQQQGVEHGLVRLPKEHQCRTLIGGNAVGVVGPVISCPCDSRWVSSGVQPVSVVLAPRRLARIWGWQ